MHGLNIPIDRARGGDDDHSKWDSSFSIGAGRSVPFTSSFGNRGRAARAPAHARTLGHIALLEKPAVVRGHHRCRARSRSVAAIRKTATPFGAHGHEQPHNKPLMRPPLPLPPPPPSSLFPRTAPVLALATYKSVLSHSPPSPTQPLQPTTPPHLHLHHHHHQQHSS